MLYLYAGAEFLAFLFLIVYVGAIAILFLFVIMLLHFKQLTAISSHVKSGSVLLSLPAVIPVVVGLDIYVTTGIASFFVNANAFVTKTALISAAAVE